MNRMRKHAIQALIILTLVVSVGSAGSSTSSSGNSGKKLAPRASLVVQLFKPQLRTLCMAALLNRRLER